MQGEELPVYGDGKNVRDWLYVTDHCQAIDAVIHDESERGCTVVMTTHDLGQAKRFADRVLFLHGGKLVENASAIDFFDRPASAEARAFLAGELAW